MTERFRPAWVEIDLDAVRANTQAMRGPRLRPGSWRW